jgi:NADPH:quinone reductase-like Zn-dependent oxidoreductase
MKAVVFQTLGGPEVLEIVSREINPPGPGEVRVRVTSVGLNRADLLFVQGRYFQKATLPSRVGMEPAGVVERVGAERVGEGPRWQPGDRVGVLPSSFDLSAQGGLAEYVTVLAKCLVPTPASLDDRDAAALWMQYLTVWGALRVTAPIESGNFVVITAASSSVGLAAIECVKMFGAIPIATTTSAGKVARLMEHGAAHVINMKDDDYPARIKEITAGQGVHVVFDAVGGPGMSEHVRACRQGGVILLYGLLDTRPMDFAPGLLIGKQLRLIGYTIRSLQENPAALARAVSEIGEAVTTGRLRPVVDRRFPLSEVRAAFEHMASNQQFGKLIVNP